MIDTALIANPQSPRVEFFQNALASLGLAPAQRVTYEDLLAKRCSLEEYDRPDIWFRFESPERNFGCDRALIAAGADLDPSGPHHRISAKDAFHLPADKGRIFYPRQWYLGWQKSLLQWVAPLKGNIMNHPDDIVIMFDKVRCQQRLGQSGIPVPPTLSPCLQDYDQLQAAMDEVGCDRVFIKLAHGSSASGVMAYERYRGKERAITTVERTIEEGELRFYNSRKIFQYRNPDHIADVINVLAKERIQVEAWLPKARIEGREFDLRVVVIGGNACHTVVRLGRSPMTNLHLGSDRRSVDPVRDRLRPTDWETMMHTCERAAACFPKSLYCGVDLLIAPNWKDHYVLEVNAFGDLAAIPNLKCSF